MQADRDPLVATDLPDDVADAFHQVTGTEEPPDTLAAGVAAVESMMEEAGFQITFDQMYQPDPTRHAVHLGDRVEHVPCVLDALIAARLEDASPVTVESEPPTGGEPVELVVAGADVSATPETAVFSWGFADDDVRPPGQQVAPDETVSMASCSYINAFHDAAAYRQWREGLSDGVVMRLDLDAMAAFADRAAGGWVVAG